MKLQYVKEINNIVKKREKEEMLILRKKLYPLTFTFEEYKYFITEYKVLNLISKEIFVRKLFFIESDIYIRYFIRFEE